MCRTAVNTFSNLIGTAVVGRARGSTSDVTPANHQREDSVGALRSSGAAPETSRSAVSICVIGTDGSGPMAIDYFEQMGGQSLFDPSRVFFSLDHYAPPDTPQTMAFHRRIRDVRGGARRDGVRGRRRHQPSDRGGSRAGRRRRSRGRRRQPHGDVRRAQLLRDWRRIVGPGRRDDDRADLAARAGDHSRHLARPPAGGCRGEGRRAVPDRRDSAATARTIRRSSSLETRCRRSPTKIGWCSVI